MNKSALIIILLTLVLSSPGWAATRFYLPSSGAAEVSPPFDAAWDDTASADRMRCVTRRLGTAMTDKTIDGAWVTYGICNRQYVSDPIAAQTISGTVKGQLRGYEESTNTDAYSSIVIKVVSNDGSTVRGTLLAKTDGSNEYPTGTLTNRYTPASTAISSVVAESGDRIVIEVGWQKGWRRRMVTQSFGDNSGTDLAENETETNANNPWIEFSQDIRFPSVSVDG